MILYQARVNGGITMTRNNVIYVYNPFNKVGKRFLEVFSSFCLVKHVGNITHSCLRWHIHTFKKKKNSSFKKLSS